MLLRFFFDAGSGVCLWAYDAEAKARFGYPVEADMLDVSAELRAEIEQLVADCDDTFPWDDPGWGEGVEPSPAAAVQAGAPDRAASATVHRTRIIGRPPAA